MPSRGVTGKSGWLRISVGYIFLGCGWCGFARLLRLARGWSGDSGVWTEWTLYVSLSFALGSLADVEMKFFRRSSVWILEVLPWRDLGCTSW